jgi:hypothetical protein
MLTWLLTDNNCRPAVTRSVLWCCSQTAPTKALRAHLLVADQLAANESHCAPMDNLSHMQLRGLETLASRMAQILVTSIGPNIA